MEEKGIDTYIEIGPGKVLSGFVKKQLKDLTNVKILNICDCTSFDNTINEIKG